MLLDAFHGLFSLLGRSPGCNASALSKAQIFLLVPPNVTHVKHDRKSEDHESWDIPDEFSLL